MSSFRHEAETHQYFRRNILPSRPSLLVYRHVSRFPLAWNLSLYDLHRLVLKWSVSVINCVSPGPPINISTRASAKWPTHFNLPVVLASTKQPFTLNRSGISRVSIHYLSDHICTLRSLTLTRKVLWGSKIAKDPPSITYDEVVTNEYGLYKWLSKIVSSHLVLRFSFFPFMDFNTQHTFGFCFVSGSPHTPEATEALVKRIGFIRETHCEISRRVISLSPY